MTPHSRSLTIPKRKSISCVTIFSAVALAFPRTIRVLGIYIKRIGASTTSTDTIIRRLFPGCGPKSYPLLALTFLCHPGGTAMPVCALCFGQIRIPPTHGFPLPTPPNVYRAAGEGFSHRTPIDLPTNLHTLPLALQCRMFPLCIHRQHSLELSCITQANQRVSASGVSAASSPSLFPGVFIIPSFG